MKKLYLSQFDKVTEITKGMSGDKKYWAPDELDSIMALNKSVLNMFEGMENPIPRWYRE